MTKTINVSLSKRSIKDAIKQLETYKKEIKENTKLMVEMLQDIGVTSVQATIAVVPSFSETDVDLRVVPSKIDTNGNIVSATLTFEGKDVLFIEFGAGIRYSSIEHPMSQELGYGAGTYPSDKNHWDNPKGWWYKGEDGLSHHSYGFPALQPMYIASSDMEQRIIKVAKEVFK